MKHVLLASTLLLLAPAAMVAQDRTGGVHNGPAVHDRSPRIHDRSPRPHDIHQITRS